MRCLSLPIVGLAALLVGCGDGEPPAGEEYPDAVMADPGHYAVEFENDAARLLRITYGPGETSVMHRHPANCSIALSASSWRMTDPDGAVTDNDPEPLGTVGCGDASVHLPENTGSVPGEVILLEFKDGASPGTAEAPAYPDAVAADPRHYAVEFENDVVRVLRIAYEPGGQSVLHHHPANCSVALNDATWQMTDAAGAVTENTRAAGSVSCGDAGVHRPANGGTRSSGVILIEFKNRATFAQ